ncbi:DedA family protein [Gemmatimonas sp.]|uniref:DedA family protein n=1 Tax=Gemmatimonas sp. TaxID=1962908 RepID=UPI003DA30854
MNDLLAWLTGLPDPLLYGALALAAFAENVFPPLPADTVIALGAFVAARGNGSWLGAWIATMVGNIGGAMLMYGLGHRFGLPWLMRRFPTIVSPTAADRFAQRFSTQGMAAVVVSRFLPGVRALVPPMAGALGIGAVRAAVAMSLASGVWYGIICLLAFRAGANAEQLLALIASQQRTIGLAALALTIAVVLYLLWRRRRAKGAQQ